MSLSQRLAEYIAAAFSGIYIQSYEHEDALKEIAQLCQERQWALATWDIEKGLSANGQAAPGSTDPLAALRSISALAKPDSSALLVLPNFHRFLSSTEIVQALAHQIHEGKNRRTFIVILSPVLQIPVELEKSFVVLEHDLPDRQQLQQIACGIATEQDEMPQGEDLEKLMEAAAGLTRYEAEGAFCLSLVRHHQLLPQTVWELKEGMLKKSGLLTLHRGTERFADLGGLDAIKSFCTRALGASKRKSSARPRGILLLSPPGCGKAQPAVYPPRQGSMWDGDHCHRSRTSSLWEKIQAHVDHAARGFRPPLSCGDSAGSVGARAAGQHQLELLSPPRTYRPYPG